jgi:hypothetical protein
MIVGYDCLLGIIERRSLLDVGDGLEMRNINGRGLAVSFLEVGSHLCSFLYHPKFQLNYCSSESLLAGLMADPVRPLTPGEASLGGGTPAGLAFGGACWPLASYFFVLLPTQPI